MKEASGELNMTVITVIAIAAIGALLMTVLWPRITSTIENAFQSNDCTTGYDANGNCNG